MDGHAGLYVLAGYAVVIPAVANIAAYLSIGTELKNGVPRSKIMDSYLRFIENCHPLAAMNPGPCR